ncbi:MAG: DNA translocase FtsK [Anaerolineaceae bacterium]|nr:DNA translocase FtsK [Anaerolineaceae bacterium]
MNTTSSEPIWQQQQRLMALRSQLPLTHKNRMQDLQVQHKTAREKTAHDTLTLDLVPSALAQIQQQDDVLLDHLRQQAQSIFEKKKQEINIQAESKLATAQAHVNRIQQITSNNPKKITGYLKQKIKDEYLHLPSINGQGTKALEEGAALAEQAETTLKEIGEVPIISGKVVSGMLGSVGGLLGGIFGGFAVLFYLAYMAIVLLIGGGWLVLIIGALIFGVIMEGLGLEWEDLPSLIGVLIGIIGIGGFLFGLLGGVIQTDEDKKKQENFVRGYTAAATISRLQYNSREMMNRARGQIEAERKQALKAYSENLTRMYGSVETFGSALKQAETEHQQRVADTSKRHQQEQDDLQHSRNEHFDKLSEAAALSLPWYSPYWKSYKPPRRNDANSVPHLVRVGDVDGIPQLMPLVGSGHLIIRSNRNTKAAAQLLLQSIVTRILVTFPVFSFKAILVDPLGLGSTFPYKGVSDRIIGASVYSESADIRQQIKLLTDHISTMLQQNFGRDFESIEEYNQHATDVVEAYRLLCVADFPAKFDRQELNSLLSIAERGTQTGIYLVMHLDMDADLPRDFDMQPILDHAMVIDVEAHGQEASFSYHIGDQVQTFTPDALPERDVFNYLMEQLGEQTRQGDFVAVPFERIAPAPPNWWEADSRSLLDVPIGRMGARDVLNFWLGERQDKISSYHAVIGGRTGSGKSMLLHVLINSLALTYSPDELQLYLVDFKQGVEFITYAEGDLPHARVIAIASEREFGLSVLKGLADELSRRARLFQSDGISAPNLATYRDMTGEKLPRILLIIDEFQVLLSGQDSIATQAAAILKTVAEQGRSFGVHVVMASQSLKGTDVRQSLDQFATRVALQLSEPEAEALLGADGGRRIKALQRPGAVIYTHDYVQPEQSKEGQVALLKTDDIHKILHELRHKAATHPLESRPEMIIFDGNRPSLLSENQRLQSIYNMASWPSAAEVREQLDLLDWEDEETPAMVWLGEAMAIKPHTSMIFRRVSRSHLLLVGDHEETIYGLFESTLLSLPAFYRPQDVQIRFIDLSLRSSAWANTPENFQEAFSDYDIHVREKRGAAILLEECYQMVQARQEQAKYDDELLGPSVFLFVGGIHKFEELRTVPSRGREEPSEHTNKLTHILRYGAEVGVHVIMWSDSLDTLKDRFDRGTHVQLFDWRVALSMPEDKLREIMSGNLPGSLKPQRAWLYNARVANEQAYEKFKPYSLAAMGDDQLAIMRSWSDRLHSRMGQTVVGDV